MDSKEFSNQVFPHWEDAMDRFFGKVDAKREQFGMTTAEVRKALVAGYGVEVADEWAEWAGV